MQIASIVPIPNLYLIKGKPYHMALAHLVQKSAPYADFYWAEANRGAHVLMDNGVVENGVPLPIEFLVNLASSCGAKEIVLPDVLFDRQTSLSMHRDALAALPEGLGAIGVPQGKDQADWLKALDQVVELGVPTIGISRFVSRFFSDRFEALAKAMPRIPKGMHIHLLGCIGDPLEIHTIEIAWPRRVRGVDSGIATLYTQVGQLMRWGAPKPTVELDSYTKLGEEMLAENIAWWEGRCRGEAAVSPREDG
jgi:hypothetical protein